jgi:hypothetical protein
LAAGGEARRLPVAQPDISSGIGQGAVVDFHSSCSCLFGGDPEIARQEKMQIDGTPGSIAGVVEFF